jgi:hypothetical protein
MKPTPSAARLNVKVKSETKKACKIIAAETGKTLEATVEWLIAAGIDQWKNGRDD